MTVDLAGRPLSTAEVFSGQPPPRRGWRFDPILDIDGVLQVGCFDADLQASIPAACDPFLVWINEQTNQHYRGREAGHVRWVGAKHAVPSADCWCGWYYTADRGAARIMTLFPQQHHWVPLRGYAVTRVAAEGVVLGSRTVDDSVGSWRTERLVIDGPMHLDLLNADDYERVRDRYPTAVPHVLQQPERTFDCHFPVAPPPVPDATISDFLQQVVIDLCAGREVLGERRQVVRGVALTLHHLGRRDHLARIAWACMDFARFEEPGRLAFECNQHPDFEDLAGDPPAVLGIDEILTDPMLTVAAKAVALHGSEVLTGRW